MLAAPLLYPKLLSLHTEKHLMGKCVDVMEAELRAETVISFGFFL